MMFLCEECKSTFLTKSGLCSHYRRRHRLSNQEYIKRHGLEKIEAMLVNDTSHSEQRKNLETIAKREGLSSLSCPLCDFTSMFSLISHITRRHRVSMDDVRKTYPTHTFQQELPSKIAEKSKRTKEVMKRSDVRKKVLAGRSFPSEVIHWLRKGLSLEQAREEVTKFQSRQAKRADESTRSLRRTRMSGKNNPMSLEGISRRLNVTLEDARKLTPCYGRVGEKHPMWRKTHTPEALEKIADAKHLKDPTWRSKPEMEMASWCKETFGSDVKENVKIGRWNIDVVIPSAKLVIELFGDSWHMNPKRYSATDVNSFTRKTAAHIWEHDKRKIEALNELGYEVVIVWETDWKMQRQLETKRIKDAHDRT